ncbi:uncharacterized protein HMPREF1541_01092 [Cyphellophora europaea CBS 101466]|uniref:Uncharacterized protein n=1 Tax=Cyphellophora europaea (strain CBS 101466) TaxID=1220924 RepID=W2SFY6_CYPE1|nr:uncharacterized protein HMPREF1541_01092 [Cyphellophora europaea CBS 101466]ETN46903.1 hypothetical protein HMPREF1541_01092 [Cyphellophora europaea CBS 101466]
MAPRKVTMKDTAKKPTIKKPTTKKATANQDPIRNGREHTVTLPPNVEMSNSSSSEVSKVEKEPKADSATYIIRDIPTDPADAISRMRSLQDPLREAARTACTIVADAEAACGQGMTRRKQKEVKAKFDEQVDKVGKAMKALNDFKSSITNLATKEIVEDRVSVVAFGNNDVRKPSLPFGEYNRRASMDAVAAGKMTKEEFAAEVTQELLNATMRLLGGLVRNDEALDASIAVTSLETVIGKLIDPTFSGGSDVFEAISSITTPAGLPVFVAGSLLEQQHRVIHKEVFAELVALKKAGEELPMALKKAGKVDVEEEKKEKEKKEKGEKREKKENQKVEETERASVPSAAEVEGMGKGKGKVAAFDGCWDPAEIWQDVNAQHMAAAMEGTEEEDDNDEDDDEGEEGGEEEAKAVKKPRLVKRLQITW